MKITALGYQAVYKQRPAPPPPVHQDVVLIGEMRSNQRLITRNNLLALFGSAVVCTSVALLASGEQSALMAGLVGVPLGLVASRWLNSELRARGREIEEQLRR